MKPNFWNLPNQWDYLCAFPRWKDNNTYFLYGAALAFSCFHYSTDPLSFSRATRKALPRGWYYRDQVHSPLSNEENKNYAWITDYFDNYSKSKYRNRLSALSLTGIRFWIYSHEKRLDENLFYTSWSVFNCIHKFFILFLDFCRFFLLFSGPGLCAYFWHTSYFKI